MKSIGIFNWLGDLFGWKSRNLNRLLTVFWYYFNHLCMCDWRTRLLVLWCYWGLLRLGYVVRNLVLYVEDGVGRWLDDSLIWRFACDTVLLMICWCDSSQWVILCICGDVWFLWYWLLNDLLWMLIADGCSYFYTYFNIISIHWFRRSIKGNLL